MRKSLLYFQFTLLLVLVNTGCYSVKAPYVSSTALGWNQTPLPSTPLKHTTFLIGDVGDPPKEGQATHPPLAVLQQELIAVGSASTTVYLGDNIYPKGLPKKDKPDRSRAESAINLQLEVLNGYTGKAYFIPGNHDWEKSGDGGLKAIKRQENYIEKYFDKNNIKGKFVPNNGCGDPIRVKREKNLVFIFIDSEWYLHDWRLHKKINKGCEIKSRIGFLEELEALILDNKNKQLVICMHHPLFTNGNHGGRFSFKQHMFPLLELNKYAYVPLPLLGSIYPIFRSAGGSHQDVSHPRYQELKKHLLTMVKKHKNIIFAAGHEHSLQYRPEGNNHFIVSGSGCKTTHLRPGFDAEFSAANMGYSKLYHYENGATWLEMIRAEGSRPEVIFRKQLVTPTPGTKELEDTFPEVLPDSITASASDAYQAKGMKIFLLGDQYRTTWSTPIKTRVLNLQTEYGGLTPIKKGGGMASNSLRLQTSDGKQYALRSVDKDMSKILGPEFAELEAMKLMIDQTSAIHPYGALPVAVLSESAQIYHINSDLIYLKKQQGLGAYNNLFPEGMYLLEERPAGDRSELAIFGNSKDIIGYIDLLDKMKGSYKHYVDQEWVVKSRLFDVFIHDWDRHDDQWRWASFPQEDGKTMYRPIARDRDQAFYRFKGLIPSIIGAIGVRKFKAFKPDLKDVTGQCYNARYFDRYFTNSMNKEDWLKIANELKAHLSDKAIEEAFDVWPGEIYDKSAPEIIENLKSRRDRLDVFATKLYEFISEGVDVLGTDDREKFVVDRLENGDTRVQVYHLKKKGKQGDKIYDRTFHPKITKEIRLYGLDGKDIFIVSGKTSRSIKVRIIGGDDKDEVTDNSKVSGWSRKTKIYDQPKGIKIEGGSETRKLLSENTEVNEYDREAFLYNTSFPSATIGYTKDDGIWIGGGGSYIKNGFRKLPYRAKHLLNIKYAPERGSLVADYKGDYIEAIGKLDLLLKLGIHNPEVLQFFGLGNETLFSTIDKDFNRIRLRRYFVSPLFKQGFDAEKIQLRFGPSYESVRLEEEVGRISGSTDGVNFPQEIFTRKHYAVGVLGLSLNTIERPSNPREGVFVDTEISQHIRIDGGEQSFGNWNVAGTFYLTFGRRFPTTVASRTGYGVVWGNPDFHQRPSIGNNNFLRGYRNNRFTGTSMFYQNVDLRIKLANWYNKILPMDVGIMGGYDVGRVWLSGENSNQLHQSITAGIWFSPLSAIVLSPHFSFSKEEKQFNFRIGFNF